VNLVTRRVDRGQRSRGAASAFIVAASASRRHRGRPSSLPPLPARTGPLPQSVLFAASSRHIVCTGWHPSSFASFARDGPRNLWRLGRPSFGIRRLSGSASVVLLVRASCPSTCFDCFGHRLRTNAVGGSPLRHRGRFLSELPHGLEMRCGSPSRRRWVLQSGRCARSPRWDRRIVEP